MSSPRFLFCAMVSRMMLWTLCSDIVYVKNEHVADTGQDRPLQRHYASGGHPEVAIGSPMRHLAAGLLDQRAGAPQR
jgi:hypothetical protein